MLKETGPPAETQTNRPGNSHLCLTVDDLRACYDDLKTKGVRFKSEPVTITVLAAPPLIITTNIHLNLQTGLFDQAVRVFNPTGSSYDAVRLYISNCNSVEIQRSSMI